MMRDLLESFAHTDPAKDHINMDRRFCFVLFFSGFLTPV